jgi:translocation and assembly module TamB
MEIISGYAEFLEAFPFNPKARFVCTRNFGDIVVYFDMENTPGRGVSFDLYSTPNYSKDVILSNMLFGKDLKYLSVSEAAQLAHVMASFSGHGYIFSVLNTFQNIGIIDSLSFTSSDKRTHSLNVDKSSSSEKGVNVSAGKYVSDNVFISINKNSEGATFDVDLSLTPKISVKANTAGEAGISWKYRY